MSDDENLATVTKLPVEDSDEYRQLVEEAQIRLRIAHERNMALEQQVQDYQFEMVKLRQMLAGVPDDE